MSVDALSDSSRRRNPLLLPVRFLLYWAIKLLVLLFLGVRFLFRPAPVRYGLLILLVGGAVAWKAVGAPAFLPWSSGSSAQHEMVSTTVTKQLPPMLSVEQYMRAQSDYDAKTMWSTLSDKFKQKMALASNTEATIQRDLDNAKQQGRRYTAVAYVGGYSLTGGQAAYFYVLTVEGPNGTTQIPYTFIVDPDGKISNIQWGM